MPLTKSSTKEELFLSRLKRLHRFVRMLQFEYDVDPTPVFTYHHSRHVRFLFDELMKMALSVCQQLGLSNSIHLLEENVDLLVGTLAVPFPENQSRIFDLGIQLNLILALSNGILAVASGANF